MKPEDVVLKLKYKNKEEENYMKERMAEYYSLYPQDKISDSDSYHSCIDYEERCRKIREAYNNR